MTNKELNQKILASSSPIIIDFYADWCGPCKAMASTLEQISEKLGDNINIIKVDIEDSPDISSEFEIRSIPTLILVNSDKEIVEQITGFMGSDVLLNKIYKIVDK
jgi:thioredoxin 1